MRRGRKSAAQTPAPAKERIYGSSKNPKGSAASKSSASSITLNTNALKSLKEKREKFNKEHPKNKVELSALKAVMRRGMGAYSSSHRPTITGGKPNSRQAWGLARVNKFLEKKAGKKVKAAYVQDDDLMENGGVLSSRVSKFMRWYIEWLKGVSDKMNVFISIPNELQNVKGLDNYVFLDLFEKIDQNIDAKPYLQDIVDKADDFGVTIVLEPISRKNNIDKQYLIDYYSKFGFVLNKNKAGMMLRTPKYSKYEGGGLIAPNGKPSNLTAEQYKLVRTPQFKAFFGDWENDPANASKVVDENGEPLVVYHGTNKQFNEFKKGEFGFHFGGKKAAKERGKIVKPYFLSIKKQLWFDYDLGNWNDLEMWKEYSYAFEEDKYAEFVNTLNTSDNINNFKADFKKLYDGVKYFNAIEGDLDEYSFIVFEPNQIKLADGTNTTFDTNNPDIRYEGGGFLHSIKVGIDNLIKNGIVLTDKAKNITVIAYNTGNQNIDKSLYNKALIYHSIQPLRQANEIIESFDNNEYSPFDAEKIEEYKNSPHLIIVNQNEVVFDSSNPNRTYAKGGLIAPNGKPSNLTEEQYKLVRTPEFKAWFGDWENNDPKYFSKVVDENGEPLVVYRRISEDMFSADTPYNTNIVGILAEVKWTKNYNYLSRKLSASNVKAGDLVLNEKNKKVGKLLSVEDSVYTFQYFNGQIDSESAFYLQFMSKEPHNIEDIIAVFLNIRILGDSDKRSVYSFTTQENSGVKSGDLYFTYRSEQAKLADGSNKTFDKRNPDARYQKGGKMNNFIALPDTYSTYDNLKPILNKQGYDLRKVGGELPVGKLAKGMTVSEVAAIHGLTAADIKDELARGIETEMEHTDNPEIARAIALDHLYEDSQYYTKLKQIESSGKQSKEATNKNSMKTFAKGGLVGVPSTDPRTWAALYDVGDKVKVRVDMRNNRTEAKDGKVFTIESIETVLGDAKTGKGFQRPENPSGRLYHLSDSGGSWEGKDLELVETIFQTPTETLKPTQDAIYQLKTPTGEPTKLSYLQQVLVRTKAFKDFFGDWELAAKLFLSDGKQNFKRHYKNVSKVIDHVTLEPRVVYHGTRVEEEFFRFDVTLREGQGRPYGYFAYNREYSENFTQFSQRTSNPTIPLMYACFLNVRNPFMAIGSEYWQKNRDEKGWKSSISGTIVWDKYETVVKDERTQEIEDNVESQIGAYIDNLYSGRRLPFWTLMANDIEKDFKYFLLNYKYDGIFYGEEISLAYDPDNPAQYTQAVTIFNSDQVKLADGRNIDFNKMIDDIRYKKGGVTVDNNLHTVNVENMDKKEKLGQLISGHSSEKKYKAGGTVVTEHGSTNDGKKGGYFHGRSHADGGIKAINVDTGQLIEVEGEEVIITKDAVNDEKKRMFEGEMLTNREILSRINQSGGGVAFKDGGELKGHTCGCSGKKYKFGGELLEDYKIIKFMNNPAELASYTVKNARAFVDELISKMK